MTITNSLCSVIESSTTLSINYTPMIKKKKKTLNLLNKYFKQYSNYS